MNTTFTSSRPYTIWYFIKNLLTGLLIGAIPVTIDAVFKTSLVRRGYYSLFGFWCAFWYIEILLANRFYEVCIDTDSRNITLKFKAFFLVRKQISIPFSELRFKIHKTPIRIKGKKSPVSIYFIRRYKPALGLNPAKDGFSDSTFDEMCALIESLSRPVVKQNITVLR